MKIISVNIGQPKTITWNKKEEVTGIFKYPVEGSITLGTTDVEGDTVVDRRYHGGAQKACYLYSADRYDYWKSMYPELPWHLGMFGENLTVEGLDESDLNVGDIYEVGTATIEITEPRQPCYKLGIVFETQKVLKQFIKAGYPGTYVGVVKTGEVRAGDTFRLISKGKGETIAKVYADLYAKK